MVFGLALATWLAFGTLGFWIFVAAISALIAVEVGFEKGKSATVTLIATVLMVHFFSGINLLIAVRDNVSWFLFGAVAYLLIGVAWSVPKWWLETRNLSDKYNDAKRRFLREHGKFETDGKVPDELKLKWKSQVARSFPTLRINDSDGSVVPDVWESMKTIIMWMGHWPFSVLWTFFNDPVRRFFRFAYERLFKLYEKIALGNFQTAQGDFFTATAEAAFNEAEREKQRQAEEAERARRRDGGQRY